MNHPRKGGNIKKAIVPPNETESKYYITQKDVAATKGG